MNKQELIAAVAASTGESKAATGRALEAITKAISGALASGDPVVLNGFGIFSVTHRKARAGRNPATGASLQIAAKKSAKFKPYKSLNDSVA